MSIFQYLMAAQGPPPPNTIPALRFALFRRFGIRFQHPVLGKSILSSQLSRDSRRDISTGYWLITRRSLLRSLLSFHWILGPAWMSWACLWHVFGFQAVRHPVTDPSRLQWHRVDQGGQKGAPCALTRRRGYEKEKVLHDFQLRSSTNCNTRATAAAT